MTATPIAINIARNGAYTTAGETFATIEGLSTGGWLKATCPSAMGGTIVKQQAITLRPTRKAVMADGGQFLIAY